MSDDRYTVMTDEGRANVQRIVESLEQLGEAIGGWSGKSDNRQTGVSYHAKFEKKVDVMVAMAFTSHLEQAPAMLADACRKLLAADAEIIRLSLALIEAQNPGIDIEKVRAERGWS